MIFSIPANGSFLPPLVRLCDKRFIRFVEEFLKIDPRLNESIAAVFSLDVAFQLRRMSTSHSETNKVFSICCTIFTMNISRCKYCHDANIGHECSLVYFDRALSMMKCLMKEKSTADGCIMLELSKKCLYEALVFMTLTPTLSTA